MASAAMQSDFSWSMAVRRALVAAAVTLLLTIGIFGVETVSSTGKLDFATRFPEVVIIVVSLFVGSILLSLMKAGRILVPMAVTGAVFVALLIALLTHGEEEGAGFLPFKDVVIDWATLIIPAVIFARSVNLWFSAKRRAGAVESAAVAGPKRSLRLAFKILGGILLVLAFALPWLPLGDNQRKVLDIFTLVATYVMLGWGLNIVVGLAGLLDLGYVAFYAVGAYSYALLSLHLDWSFWLCLPVAGGLAALFGIMLGFPVLRLRGDYLAIVTLGFGEIIRVILINWYWFTGGPNGINKVARPSFFGLPFDKDPEPGTETFHTYFGLEFDPIHRVIFLYYLILIFALITNFFTLRMRKLPLGRAWEALREDETACRALGINPTNTKLTAFAIGAMFAGFAGSFFGARQGFVSPESFVFLQSAIILAIVVLGGLGSQIGIVLAATVLIGVPEIFRELQDYRMLAFGTGMVLIMVWRPGGLVAHRDPTIKLSPKPANGGGA